VQVLGQPGEVAEAGREPAERDGELGAGQRRHERAHRAAGELGDVDEVGPVEDDRDVELPLLGAAPGLGAQPAQRRPVGVGRRPVEDDEHGPRGGDEFLLARQRRALQRRPQPGDGGGVRHLQEQRPVTARQHPRRTTLPPTARRLAAGPCRVVVPSPHLRMMADRGG
jgi:hypothetical protein